MRLIKPSFEIWEQGYDLASIYRHIERCARVSYKSEDKITEDSAKPFVDRLIQSGHLAPLEHGTVYLKYTPDDGESLWTEKNDYQSSCFANSYNYIPYTKEDEDLDSIYITTNMRAIVEGNRWKDLKYLCKPTSYHSRRLTVRFICDIGVSREFNRHRVHSITEQSTRFCNYSKDKFNNEVSFIIPSWLDIEDNSYFNYDRNIEDWQRSEDANMSNFLQSIAFAEKNYLTLIHNRWKPQQAREVLPLCTATELVHTAYIDDWYGYYCIYDKSNELVKKIYGKNYQELDNIDTNEYRVVKQGFFPLRCDSSAHPSAKELAIPLREEFIKRDY